MSECQMCGKPFAPKFSYSHPKYQKLVTPHLFCEKCNMARLLACQTCAYYSPVAKPDAPDVFAYRRRGAYCRLTESVNPLKSKLAQYCPNWKIKSNIKNKF